jgi:RHS repeat-associated protein
VRSQGWVLDLLGNWSSIATNGTSVGRSHNRSNEITDVDTGFSGEDPTYDKNGNTTYVYRPLGENREFFYDAWNRLVAVEYDVSPKAEYKYDGLGRRIEDATIGRHYYYNDSWQLLSERDGPSAQDKTLIEYVPGILYVDEVLERDEDKNSDGDTRDAGDETLYYVQDRNWNVQTLYDEAGEVVERYLYDPYGTPSFYSSSWGSRGSSAYGNRVLFTGRLWNGETYTYDYRRREHSPHLGRFLQRDPIGIWGDEGNWGNGYNLVANDPVNLSDPSGEYGTARHATMTRECCNDIPQLRGCDSVCEKLAFYSSTWADSTNYYESYQHCMCPRGQSRDDCLRGIFNWRADKQGAIEHLCSDSEPPGAATCEALLQNIGEYLHHIQDCNAPDHKNLSPDLPRWFNPLGWPRWAWHGLTDWFAPTSNAQQMTCIILGQYTDCIQKKCCPPATEFVDCWPEAQLSLSSGVQSTEGIPLSTCSVCTSSTLQASGLSSAFGESIR